MKLIDDIVLRCLKMRPPRTGGVGANFSGINIVVICAHSSPPKSLAGSTDIFGGSPPCFLADTTIIMFYVYILKSLKNGKKYVGYTSKLPLNRLREHNDGSNKYTKGHRPYELIYEEQFDSETKAKRREKFLKTGNGRSVLNRILNNLCAHSSIG
ncbi:MAG TPA: GIY-YIG nuclease family protein [Candidatus Omnitrophota bacterium]|nr:GIY-YIG nuclease family protein [Candidatus Omnitrophota bacterium]